ncbi:MAG: M48 family metalloprotease [Adhaeribacter sp.]
MKKNLLPGLALAFLLFSNSCSTNPVTGKKDVMFVSEDQELAMGQQSDPQIVSQYGLYENAELQRFIEEKGQKMAAVSHRSNIPYSFKILDSPVINAFAVPGGYVYFTRGIMAHFNNEAQFAGVLGHEIGHVAARHSAKQQSKAMLAQLGLVVGMVVAPEFGQFANAAQQGLGLLFLKFGRDDERQSDELGVEYSTKIGYDAKEMADFFQTLERSQPEEASSLPSFLSTHPSPADRYRDVNKLAADWQKKVPQANLAVNRNAYLKRIDGIIYGEDPRQGFVESQVFYHPVLKFQFPIPTGWKYQNTPQMVQMAPQDGKAMMMLTLVQATSLQEAGQKVLQGYQLQAVESQQESVNGLPALALVAEQKQEQGVLRALVYLIEYGGNYYSLLGVSNANDFNAYFPSFSNTMKSFRQLSDAAKINRQPERLRVKTLARASTLAQALRSFQVPEKRLAELAVLNGMQLNDQVAAGTMIKVIGQ